MTEHLTIEHIRGAIRVMDLPYRPPPAPLNPSDWEDVKEAFNLTEEQMQKWFIKTYYIA